jgi:hypothetical protein
MINLDAAEYIQMSVYQLHGEIEIRAVEAEK